MSLPTSVQSYLDNLIARKVRPFTIKVDRSGKLLQWWGEPDGCGIDALELGVHVLDEAPYLANLNFDSADVLPFVNTVGDAVFDLHTIPAGDDCYVVFMPAGNEMRRHQAVQQTANEVRLLNYKQKRLLDELAFAKSAVEQREEEAARANAVKARFIAGMSHEFRTPLTSVLGYADLIAEEAMPADEMAAHALSIGRAARHLLSMVDNVLDQARLEDDSVALQRTSVNIRQLTDDLAAILAPLAAEKLLGFGAYVSHDVPDYLQTDAVRLRQIVLNIAGNAVKFTDKGEVRVEIGWRDDELVVDVIDTGRGIPNDELELIFSEFHRGSGSVGTRGAGLGLNITKRLIDLFGGSIEVKSQLGAGSRFSVRLPAEGVVEVSATGSKPPTADQAVRRGRRPLVLVAEDDPDIVQLMQIILSRANYDFTLARDGWEAIAMAMSGNPDIVLMDVNMPNLNGLRAARELRNRGFKNPIVALTASLGIDDRDAAYSFGCDGYLVKPLAAADLLAEIERYLEKATV